jgi:hypothetical protein
MCDLTAERSGNGRVSYNPVETFITLPVLTSSPTADPILKITFRADEINC